MINLRIFSILITVVVLTILSTNGVTAQHLLVIPDLSVASDDGLSSEWLIGPGRGGIDFDLVGSMSPDVSNLFWSETQASILPASSIGLGNDRSTINSELGAVLSGSWRISVATALAVATEEDNDSSQTSSGFNRFVAGGGSLSLQGIRPILLAKLGEYLRGGFLIVPRFWLNVPELSSASGVGNYGGEFATSLLLQRHDNSSRPFLTFEIRTGLVAGSKDFYQSIETKNEAFVYLAPSLTIAARKQVHISVSAFKSEAFDREPTLTLSLTLLNLTE